MHGLLAGQQGLQGPCQQHRAVGVDAEQTLEGDALQLLQPFLRSQAAVMEQAGGVDHQPQAHILRLQLLRAGREAGVVCEVEGQHPTWWHQPSWGAFPPARAPEPQPWGPLGQSLEQRHADASAAHHQGIPLPVGQIEAGFRSRCSFGGMDIGGTNREGGP